MKKFKKIKQAVKNIQKMDTLLGNKQKKIILKKILESCKNKLYFWFFFKKFENNVEKIILDIDKEVTENIIAFNDFYLQKIFSNFPGGIENYKKVIEEFNILSLEIFYHNKKDLLLLKLLLTGIVKVNLFSKYKNLEYFKLFMKNLNKYLFYIAYCENYEELENYYYTSEVKEVNCEEEVSKAIYFLQKDLEEFKQLTNKNETNSK